MRMVRIAACLFMVATVACAPPASRDSAELAALSDGWEAAFNAGDVETLVGLYAGDARVLPPNAEMRQGVDAVAEIFGEYIAAGLTGQLETVEAVTAGDLGYHVGTYTLQAPDGSLVDRGKFIEVWRREDGAWKMSNDIWNSDMPAAPAASATTLVVTHKVKDPARWLAAWSGENSRRAMFAQHGAPAVRVFQSPADRTQTGLVIEVADMAALQAFLNSPEATAAKAQDGVIDASLRIYEEVK